MFRSLATALAFVSLASVSAFGADTSWIGGGDDTTFTDPDNWTGIVPNANVAASVNDSFTLIAASGWQGGRFDNLADGDSITVDGYTFQASYADADLTLTVTDAVPEPGVLTIAGAGALGVCVPASAANLRPAPRVDRPM